MDGMAATAGVTLQPVFIPRQHSGLGRGMSMQQPGSPTGNGMAAAAASADWAYLLRNATALRGSGSLSSSDAAALLAAVSQEQGARAPSPQVMTSPGRFLLATVSAGMPPQGMCLSQQQHQQATGNSASGLFGSNSMVSLDALGHLSAEALASATCDPSNSLAMLSTGTLAPTLSNMSSRYADGGVQTLYGSNEAAAVASAAAAAAAAASARATTTQSILQQQAAAMGASNGSLANTLGAGFSGLSSSLNLNSLMQYEESLSGSLFGPGGGAVSPMPKPVSASLYIKVRALSMHGPPPRLQALALYASPAPCTYTMRARLSESVGGTHVSVAAHWLCAGLVLAGLSTMHARRTAFHNAPELRRAVAACCAVT